MKKIMTWQFSLALILLSLSGIFYTLHYLIFKDFHHIALYLIGDVAFLFVDVLIVMLILHRLLEYRDKQSLLKKLNMVIGTFFIEMGSELIKKFRLGNFLWAVDDQLMGINRHWTDKDFDYARKKAYKTDIRNEVSPEQLLDIADFLRGKRHFLLSLLGNPNLLEHESFTDLLWAVFHLADELTHRQDLSQMEETDLRHLHGDIHRVYNHLVIQWLEYMRHLKANYPYLFSLACRTNPFDPNASVQVRV